jgi:hypothetical protein
VNLWNEMHKEEEAWKTLSSGIWSHIASPKFTNASEEPRVAIFLQQPVKFHTKQKTGFSTAANVLTSDVTRRNMYYQQEITHTAKQTNKQTTYSRGFTKN